ncbi:hypothetical protein KR200_008452 [Drosophila serrata]|nr:hypothetical protein KR200_008452 [Drosophila serrata]
MLFLLWLIWTLNIFTVSAHILSSPPVLIWGIKTPKARTIFRSVTNKHFYSLMKKIQKDHMIVMYFASELSARDINCAQCFPHLKLMKPMNYYSQVEEPLKALQKVSAKTTKIVWHKPMIINQSQVPTKMKIPCQAGQIHAFNFNDRNLIVHDYAMGVSNLQLKNCPVVHAYTALTEEKQSYLRRINQSIIIRTRKQDIGRRHRSDASKDYAPHLSFTHANGTNGTSGLTILRCEQAILAYSHIMVATKGSTGKAAPIIRTHVTLLESSYSMQVGIYNKLADLDEGLVLVLDMKNGPLIIEVLPVKGNWYLTRVILDETTFYPTDLIYFSSDFSLCCSDVSFFSKDRLLLSLFDFYLDIISSFDESGMLLTYEAKPCWSCSKFLSPTLTQTLVVMFLFTAILSIGLSFITSIGRNKLVQVAAEPDLYIKTDR